VVEGARRTGTGAIKARGGGWPSPKLVRVDFHSDARHDRRMLELLIVIGRALALALRGHRELVLENLALRQQLRALERTTTRPHLQTRDRLFWIALSRVWRNWRTAVVLVQPDTVVLFLCLNDFFSGSWGWSDAALTQKAALDDRGVPVKFDLSSYSGPARKPWNDSLLLQQTRALWRFWRTQRSTPLTSEKLEELLQVDPSRLATELEPYLPSDPEARAFLLNIVQLARPATAWDDDTRQRVALSMRYLDLTRALLHEKGVRLVVTLIPFGWNVSLRDNLEGRKQYALPDVIVPMGGIEETIRAFCEQNGVEYLDLYAAFTAQEAEDEQPLYLNVDGHWNLRGHQVVAHALLDRFPDRARH